MEQRLFFGGGVNLVGTIGHNNADIRIIGAGGNALGYSVGGARNSAGR